MGSVIPLGIEIHQNLLKNFTCIFFYHIYFIVFFFMNYVRNRITVRLQIYKGL
jgi:hypothetical protein